MWFQQSPPKGATIPYRPKPQAAGGPVILAGGQAYTIQGNYAVPSAPDVSTPQFCPQGGPPGSFMSAPLSPLLAPVPVSTAPSPGPCQNMNHNTGPPQFMQHLGPPQMPLPPPGQPPEHLKNGHFPGQLIIQPQLHHLQDVSSAPLPNTIRPSSTLDYLQPENHHNHPSAKLPSPTTVTPKTLYTNLYQPIT